MPDYNLCGLSWRTFEQLVQALAAKIIGPKIVVFGDGPDGGREAAYLGPMPYPSKEHPWSGYLVVQAKFRQTAEGPGSESDKDWALRNLEEELKKFADPEKRRKPPEYYLFATSVPLSGVAGKGAKDLAYEVIEKYAGKLGIKDFDVWDHDKIRTFLDDAKDIRRAYAAWITPGDVLSQVIEWLGASRPDFGRVMLNFLQKEMRDDQSVRLDQAGHLADAPTPLAKVFVDLRVSESPAPCVPEDEKKDQPLPAGFVAKVVELGTARLDPASYPGVVSARLEASAAGPPPGRFVLVGGPGQGKTTVTQFLAQLYRAAILKENPAAVEIQHRPILQTILSQCRQEGIPLPTGRRFPIRLELKDFAKALAGEAREECSLLSYLAKKIALRAGRDVDAEDLRRWLGAYPWVLFLDGLDEVPASSNRDDVLARISDFWVDATEANADLLVIATTRPQGYFGEFRDYYRHLYLTPFSPARAMHYGKRFAAARHATDEPTRERVLSRLRDALEERSASPLMQTPLQVTIMAALLTRLPKPPRERWSLLSEYYKILYAREIEKGTPLSDLLRDHEANVNAIHQRVALQLQVESERAEGAEARMTSARFQSIVRRRLRDEGFPEREVDRIATQIEEAATQRLACLVGVEADRVGFDIPSLREFFAAEALTAGGDGVVAARLRKIAPVPHWRNVFLLAAGKCFAQRQDLRDTIHTISCQLNDAGTDGLEQAVLEGPRLALDLLEDGLARQQPKYHRLFARSALDLLQLPPAACHARLARLYSTDDDPQPEEVYQEAIRHHLTHLPPESRLGAWALLLRLMAADVPWAQTLADESWPNELTQQMDVLGLDVEPLPVTWAARRWRELIPRASPHEVLRHAERLSWPRDALGNVSEDPLVLAVVAYHRSHEFLAKDCTVFLRLADAPQANASGFFGASVSHPTSLSQALSRAPDAGIEWEPLLAAARFAVDPSKETLAAQMRRIASAGAMSEGFPFPWQVPWPLEACLRRSRAGDVTLEQIADAAEAGILGDRADWLATEQYWQTRGLSKEDMLFAANNESDLSMLLDRRCAGSLLPATHIGMVEDDVVALYESLPASRVRARLADLLESALARPADPVTASPRTVQRVLSESDCTDLDVVVSRSWHLPVDESWFPVLAGRGRRLPPTGFFWWARRETLDSDLIRALVEAIESGSEHLGLVAILEAAVFRGQECPVALEALDLQRFAEPRLRRAAITLILAQEGWEGRYGPERIAAELVELGRSDPEYLVVPLEVLAKRKPLPKAAVELLLHLRTQLPPNCWEQTGRVIEIIAEQLARRTSGLNAPEVRAELGLTYLE